MNFAIQSVSSPYTPTKAITVDWSGEFSARHITDDNISSMIEWLQRYPRKTDVRIIVGSLVQKKSGLRLKRTLQTMGYTITAKILTA